MMAETGGLEMDSGSDTNDSLSSRYTIETRRQTEYPRVAKKSTATVPEVVKPKKPASYTTRRQAALAAKALNPEKFLENFDPETSTRERRKISKKLSARRVPGALYDDAGVHINTDWDLCDCLQKSCLGCHFSCKKCSSQKCGIECRSNRKFIYDEIEYHGYDFIVKSPTIAK